MTIFSIFSRQPVFNKENGFIFVHYQNILAEAENSWCIILKEYIDKETPFELLQEHFPSRWDIGSGVNPQGLYLHEPNNFNLLQIEIGSRKVG